MNEELNKLAKIIYKEVGYRKQPKDDQNLSRGYFTIPKAFATYKDFGNHVLALKKEGKKTYKGVSIEFIIKYLRKQKEIKIPKTILNQKNINGREDKIIIEGKRKPKVIFG